MTVQRGTSNSNKRGSSSARRKRRRDVVRRYRANVDLLQGLDGMVEVPVGHGEPACRCYRCGVLLTENTVSIDRIIPGCEGGKYTDPLNIRPACLTCNSSTGGALGAARRKAS